MYHLDDHEKLTSIVSGKNYTQIEVLPALGVMIALCGTKHPEVRMYNLVDIRTAISGVMPKMMFVKLKNSSGAHHISLRKIRDAWFLSVSLKKKVILYMWDYYPHYKFLLVKVKILK